MWVFNTFLKLPICKSLNLYIFKLVPSIKLGINLGIYRGAGTTGAMGSIGLTGKVP